MLNFFGGVFCNLITEKYKIFGYNKNTKQRKEVQNMSVMSVNKSNFQELMNSEKTVLLDFYAEWCGPCRMVSPIVDEIANENPEYLVGKVNVDDESDLAASFGVSSIPMLVVIKNGKVVNQAVGARPKEQILSMLKG